MLPRFTSDNTTELYINIVRLSGLSIKIPKSLQRETSSTWASHLGTQYLLFCLLFVRSGENFVDMSSDSVVSVARKFYDDYISTTPQNLKVFRMSSLAFVNEIHDPSFLVD